jgi:hypothetical protein
MSEIEAAPEFEKHKVTLFGDSGATTRIRELHTFGWCDEFDAFCRAAQPEVVTVWGGEPPEYATRVETKAELKAALAGKLLAWAAGAAIVNRDAAEADPDSLADFWFEVDEAESRRSINRNTARSRSRDFTRAVLRNVPLCVGHPLATEIGRPFEGMPAFIVAAGPSLSKNRHLLAEAQKRGPLFVVNTSAKAVDCQIDALITIENKDVSDHWDGALDRIETVFPSIQCADSAYLTGKPTAPFFAPGSPMAEAAHAVGTHIMPSGPCVSTAAVCLAQQLGATTVVLVGQDCAYTDGLTHAVGTHYNGKKAGKTKVKLPAWGGEGEVFSRPDLVLFARWFEGYAAKCEKTPIGTVFVNATEGGASLEGWTERTLAEEIERHPLREGGELLKAMADAPAFTGDRVTALMDRVIAEAQAVMDETSAQIATGELVEMGPGAGFVDAWATPNVFAALTSGASPADRARDSIWAWLLAATEIHKIAAEWSPGGSE